MKIIRYFLALVIMMPVVTAISCKTQETEIEGNPAEEAARQTTENFIRNSPTYLFDGMEGTLDMVKIDPLSGSGSWEFTWEFTSSQAGYGDRTGQMLAQVITPHTAVIRVENSVVTSAVMDGQWDMVTQQMINAEPEVEIKPAPIDEVEVNFLKSNPVQVSIHIIGGLSDGCTTFHDAVITREGNTINIEVMVQRPKYMFCTAIYTTFEKDINLGSDFMITETYTLKVNDYTTTFDY